MSDNALFPVPESVANSALIDEAKYQAMYKQSLDDPEGFWAEQGKRIHWIKPYTKIKDVSYEGDVQIRWFYDGKLNASANCLDRHLSSRGDQVAIIWEGDDPADSKEITYAELHREVDRRAAIEWALARAAPGDVVLLAGKGHETYQEIEGTRVSFDDRQVAAEFVRRRAAPPSDLT